MTTQEYLSQVKQIDKVLICNQQELQQLRIISTSIAAQDYSKDRVQESGGAREAGFVGIVEQIMQLESKIKEDTEKLVEIRLEIRAKIEHLTNAEERVVLQAKYLLNQSWEEICTTLNLSIRQAQRVHKNALTRLAT